VDQEMVGQNRRTFGSWVAEQRQGALHAELTEKLAELTAACVELEKKGTLTLKITVEPQKDKVTLFVTDDVKVAAPVADRPSALYFADADGSLRREDPRQMKLPLREVPPRRALTAEGEVIEP
jgi:hypothetical protein